MTAPEIRELARGIDVREVEPDRDAKSMGAECTYEEGACCPCRRAAHRRFRAGYRTGRGPADPFPHRAAARRRGLESIPQDAKGRFGGQPITFATFLEGTADKADPTGVTSRRRR